MMAAGGRLAQRDQEIVSGLGVPTAVGWPAGHGAEDRHFGAGVGADCVGDGARLA